MSNNPPPKIVPRCVTVRMELELDDAQHLGWAFGESPEAFLPVHGLNVATIVSVSVEADYFARLIAECGSRRAAIAELEKRIHHHAVEVQKEDCAKNPPICKGDDEYRPDEIPF